MSTTAVISTVLALVVAGFLVSFITGVAVRLMILAAVLGGGGTVAALAGNAAGDHVTNLIDRAKQQANALPVLGDVMGDGDASGAASGARDTVVRVIDGDTVELSGAGRARLIGIDTPETVKRGHPVECHGPEASSAAKRLMPKGATVSVKRDREHRDHYGRELVYLFASDGRMVNATLVREGHARTLRIEPNTRHARLLADLQADAKNARRGMWGRC